MKNGRVPGVIKDDDIDVISTKCSRCGTEYKEYNDGGCFFEEVYKHKKLGLEIKICGLYDGTVKSRMEVIIGGVKVKKKLPYSLEFLDKYCDDLRKGGYEFKSCKSENFTYLECKCDLSVTGEPLGAH